MTDNLILICGLHWPELIRYHLLREGDRLYELAVQEEGKEPRSIGRGMLLLRGRSLEEVARSLLGDYLWGTSGDRRPSGAPTTGLLNDEQIQDLVDGIDRERAPEDEPFPPFGGSVILSFPRGPSRPR